MFLQFFCQDLKLLWVSEKEAFLPFMELAGMFVQYIYLSKRQMMGPKCVHYSDVLLCIMSGYVIP